MTYRLIETETGFNVWTVDEDSICIASTYQHEIGITQSPKEIKQMVEDAEKENAIQLALLGIGASMLGYRRKFLEELWNKANKAKWTDEDMIKAFETGRNYQLTGENNFKELINSLKPKINVEVELEMEIPNEGIIGNIELQPKLTDNKITIKTIKL